MKIMKTLFFQSLVLTSVLASFNLIRVNSPQLAAKGLFLIGALIPRSLLRGSSLSTPLTNQFVILVQTLYFITTDH